MPQREAAALTVAVIGAGAQGAELAMLALRAGFQVVVEDVFPSNLRNLKERIAEQDLSALDAERLSFAASVEDAVRRADLAFDTVPDELESKLEIFSLLDRMAPPRTILCSPMADTSISDLQACTYRADRCIAVRKDAAESWLSARNITLLRGQATSDAAAELTASAWRSMGKSVTLVTEEIAVLP